MPLPTNFWIPWNEIDPDLTHGGIEGELEGQFVGPRLGDNPNTKNTDMLTVFHALRDGAAALSMHPSANNEGPPMRNEVEESLVAWNWITERVLDRIQPTSNRLFQWCHATPPTIGFDVRPVRFPLRQEYLHGAIYMLLGTMVETAESNANGFHSGIDPQSAHKILAPLYHWKANVIKDWFDKEVAGEISEDELKQIYGGVSRPGPNIVLPGETQPTADAGDVSEVLQGISVLQWFPDTEDWTVFGNKRLELYYPERIFQPEAGMRTTEDVAPEQRTPFPGGQPA